MPSIVQTSLAARITETGFVVKLSKRGSAVSRLLMRALSVQEWKMGDVARMHRVSASGQVGNRSWMGRAIRL